MSGGTPSFAQQYALDQWRKTGGAFVEPSSTPYRSTAPIGSGASTAAPMPAAAPMATQGLPGVQPGLLAYSAAPPWASQLNARPMAPLYQAPQWQNVPAMDYRALLNQMLQQR